jgi:hypothetical protein
MFIAIGSPLFVIVVYVIYLTYNKSNDESFNESVSNILGGISASILFLGLVALVVLGVKTIDDNNKEIEKIKYDISQIEKNYEVIPGGWNDLSTMNK